MARLRFGSKRIPLHEYYEVRRMEQNARGETVWNTLKNVKSAAKAMQFAKQFELDGRYRIQIVKVTIKKSGAAVKKDYPEIEDID